MQILTHGDRVLLISLFGVIVSSFFLMNLVGDQGEHAVVLKAGKPLHKLNLFEPSRTAFEGSIGEVVVETRNGSIAVISSQCQNRVCVKTGWRSKRGDVIVCVPNTIVVRILGATSHRVHGITG
jgi:hypothetical protein